MTQEAFKAWWYNEGSQAPYTHHDCEEHTMRMCEIAWNKAQFLAQPEQEPVGLIESLKIAQPCCGEYETCWRPCTPRGKFLGQRDAQRTWVGLTDEEIGTIAYNVNPLDGIRQFSRAIEAKLKEKNT